MKVLEQEVQALLHAAQQDSKTTLDHGRVDTTFQVGDQVLLRTAEQLDAAEIGKLRPRWKGPFGVIALAGPNTYTLALQRRFRCSPTVNLECLKPYHASTDKPDPPGPVADPGQAGEYVTPVTVVEQLLNRKILRGRTYYLARWRGHDSADDSWEPAEHLAQCPERVAEYEAAAPRRLRARRAAAAKSPGPVGPEPGGPPPAPVEAPTPVAPPAGWAVGPAGAPALRASVLYWWPAYGSGWHRGVVARLCNRAPYSHVVRYRRPTAWRPLRALERRAAPRRPGPLLWPPLAVDRPRALWRAPRREHATVRVQPACRRAGTKCRHGPGSAGGIIDVSESFIACDSEA
jgi:hypothetical protein